MPYTTIEVKPLAGSMGAEIFGVDLSAPLPDSVLAEIKQAFLDYLVIFFRDQELTPETHIAFARQFGEIEVHPIVQGMDGHPEIIRIFKDAGEATQFGDTWHSDNSFFECPSLGSVLYGVEIPPYGGDTLFANMYMAYEFLSSGMKSLLDGLKAIHTAADAYDPVRLAHKYRGETAMKYTYSDVVKQTVEHPVVRTHPVTGRKSLFVNRMFTRHFRDMTAKESQPLLDFLSQHAIQPEFQCRFRWQPKSVAFWDNRCTMHYAMNDCQAFRRVMHRVTVKGDRPY